MSLYRKTQSIKAQMVEMQRLSGMVADHPLMSIGLTERLHALQQELESLPKESSEPKVQLLFSGKAVVGSQGIKSTFLSKTIPPFQAMVKTQVAVIRYGEVGQRGKAKKTTNADLYLTALPVGSFGVELSQLESTELFDGVEVSKAIKDVMNLIASSTADSDTFEANIENVPKRILSNLKKFLQEIANEKSVLKMESGELGIELTKDQIAEASQKVSSTIDDDEEIFIEGFFRGVLPESGRFEVQDEEGKTISGFVSPDLEEDELIKYNSFSNTKCRIHLRIFKAKSKTSPDRSEFELFEVKQI